MEKISLKLANVLLHIAHIALILIVFAGWWFCETRLISLVLILGTLISWYGLKPFFAADSEYGYCVITDLQWAIRRRLGLSAPESGYMKYLSDRLIGRDIDSDLIEKFTLVSFVISIVGVLTTSVFLGWCFP